MGKKVLLLEQHYIPGGCATSFKRKDFVMEVGLHEMDGLYDKDMKMRIFDFLEVDKHVKFEKVPELFHLITDKFSFTFPHGNQEAQKVLTEKFPHEAKGIEAFLKIINGVLEDISKMPRERWKQILTFPLMPILYPKVVQASRITIGQWLDRNISDNNLKLILLANILYYGDDPYNLSLMFFSVAQASFIGGGGHFIKGGSQKLSDYLSDYILRYGGQILLGKTVEKILIENGRACGIVFCDTFNKEGKPIAIKADSIIGNAAIPLIAEMLPYHYGKLIRKKIKGFKESCSLITIYMGFDINLKEFGVKHYSTFLQGDGVENPKDIQSNYRGAWSKKGFVFVNYSQIDSALAPAGKSVGIICAADYLAEWNSLDDAAYKAKKEEIANHFFRKLDACYPGIISHLSYYEVGTAKTIQRYTLNPEGAPYGFAQTPSQSGMRRIPAQSPVKNLFFASAWSFPGGGFTGVIIGGFLCAMLMNKKVKWKSQEPGTLKDERVVKLLQKKTIAENTLELTFEKPADFNHKPGEYVQLKLNNPKTNYLDVPFRSLSIVSHPDEIYLRFAIRMSSSSFKQSCHEMAISDTATLFGPTGNFTFKKDIQDVVFLACGIGITPIMAMLTELEKRQHPGKVFLFYSNKILQSAAYHENLLKINLKNYSYIPVITSTSKRIDSELLRRHLVELNNFDYYLVGTSDFLRSMERLLKTEGVNISKIKEDDFG
jgi:all-trans-retinol 13,14-reductase